MESVFYALGYLMVGIMLFRFLWVKMRIVWQSEDTGTKLLLTAVIPAWPVVILLFVGIWVSTLFGNRK